MTHLSSRIPLVFFTQALLFSAPSIAEIITDGSLGNAVSLGGPEYSITEDLGSRHGNNLFHSFSRFNLYTDENATFLGNASIENIISRVTGSAASYIDGTLQSEIPGANLFFINPKGVFFGENARLDIDGSFYVSTADSLDFTDGSRFNTTLQNSSTLTIAPPSSFGFLGENITPVLIYGSRLLTPPKTTIGVMAGDIRVSGSDNGRIGSPSGTVNLSTLNTAGSITLSGKVSPAQNAETIPDASIISLSAGTEISTIGDNGGEIRLEGNHIIVEDSTLYANTLGTQSGEGVQLNAGEHIEITNSTIQSATIGSGDAGTIRISTPYLLIDNHSKLLTASFGTGAGGDIWVHAIDVLIQGGSQLISQATEDGAAGNIQFTISNGLQLLGDPNNIYDTRFSTASYGAGTGGDVQLTTKTLEISGALIDSASNSEGAAGDVTITTDRISLKESGQIITATSTAMPAGRITISADDQVTIEGTPDAEVWTGLFSVSHAGGDAGGIAIESPNLVLSNAWIDATTNGPGDGGDILLDLNQSLAMDKGLVRVTTGNSGAAGKISINTNRLSATNDSHIGAMSVSSGFGGDITIKADTIEMDDGAEITNEAYYNAPGTGKLTINVSDSLHMIGTSEGKDPNPGADRVSTGIFSFTGDIEVNAKNIILEKSAAISTRTFNDIDDGDLVVNTDRLEIFSGAQINTDSFGSSGYRGLGGNIVIDATGSILIDGVTSGRYSGIHAGTRSSGDAGQITVITPYLEIRNEGSINTSTGVFGEGSAGDIRINTDRLNLNTDGGLLSSSVGYGDGGNILVEVSDTIEINDGYMAAYGYRYGMPGVITINAPKVMMDQGLIRTSSYGTEAAGNIAITATSISLNRSTIIESLSTENNINAGAIQLSASNLIESRQSMITTAAEKGSGGNIELNAPTVNLVDAPITATVAGGEGGGGNVTINATAFGAVQESDITARADQGLGGRILINGDVFLRAESVNLDASSNVEGNSGVVEINAPEMNLSGSVSELNTDFLNITALMDNRCLTLSTENRSSLVVSGSGGLAPAPDDYLLGSTVGVIPLSMTTNGGSTIPESPASLISMRCHGFGR